MNIANRIVGDDYFTNQLQITVSFGLPVQLKVVFYSAGRDWTDVEIFDQHGDSMGRREFNLGLGLNVTLVEDLNVLLDEFGIQASFRDFARVSHDAHRFCDARYGNGIQGGDVVITIN